MPSKRNGAHLRSRRCSPSASPPSWWRSRSSPGRSGCARAATATATAPPRHRPHLDARRHRESTARLHRRAGRRRAGPRRPSGATRDGRAGGHHHRPAGHRRGARARSPGSRWRRSPSWSTSAAAAPACDAALRTAHEPRCASSKLVLVGRTAQMDVLAAHCGGHGRRGPAWARSPGALDRRSAARRRGATIKPAHDAADTSATRPAHASPTPSSAGSAGPTSATVDLDDDAFSDWVRRLERSIPYFGGPQGTPFEQFLLLPVDQRRRHDRGRGRGRGRCPQGRADRRLPCAHGAGGRGARDLGRRAPSRRRRRRGRRTARRCEAGWDGPGRAAPPGGLPAPACSRPCASSGPDVVR